MELVTIALIIIAVNTLITILIFAYFVDLVLERFKMEDKFDEGIIKGIKVICKELGLKCKTSTIEFDKRK